MVTGTAGHQLETALLQRIGKRCSIFDDLPGIRFKFGLQGLAKSHSFSGNSVFMWTALHAREHRPVN